MDRLGDKLAFTPGACLFISGELFEELSGFDEDLMMSEDHELGKTASKMSNYKFLSDLEVKTSTRRFNEEGRLTVYSKYLFCFLYRIINGKMSKRAVEYKF